MILYGYHTGSHLTESFIVLLVTCYQVITAGKRFSLAKTCFSNGKEWIALNLTWLWGQNPDKAEALTDRSCA